MRLNQITAGEEYATCDGALVVPESPVERGFFTVDHTKSPPLYVWNTEGALDPWGGCMKAQRPADVGIKCRKYTPDRDGRRSRADKGTLVCIPPRDIKGSWTEFLVLYAERVRNAADLRDSEEKAQVIDTEMNTALHAAFPQGTRGFNVVKWHWGFRNVDKHQYIEELHISLYLTPDEFAAIMRKMGKPLSRGLLKRVKDAYRTRAEFLQIIRAP